MIDLELHDEFHEASKLTGEERLSKVEEYAILQRKSNLLEYVRYHVSQNQWDEMESFVTDIRTREEEIRREIRLDYLTNRAEWREFDPTHLIGCAQAGENTKWLVPFLKMCTKAHDESPYYTYFTVHKFDKQLGKVYPVDFEIKKVKEKFFEEGDYGVILECPNDGEIGVTVEFELDGPNHIHGIEYLGRLGGGVDSVPSLAEATVQEHADSGWPLGKEYDSILRIFYDD